MTRDNGFQSNALATFRQSSLWEVYIPFTAAAIPAGIFALLGFVTNGLDKPGAEAPLWVIVTMVALEILGIIAMAVVILTRSELAFKELLNYTNGHSPAWRGGALMLSFVCLLLFDVLTNISAAFSGAGLLIVGAIPAFFAYVGCGRVALVGLRPKTQSTSSSHNYDGAPEWPISGA